MRASGRRHRTSRLGPVNLLAVACEISWVTVWVIKRWRESPNVVQHQKKQSLRMSLSQQQAQLQLLDSSSATLRSGEEGEVLQEFHCSKVGTWLGVRRVHTSTRHGRNTSWCGCCRGQGSETTTHASANPHRASPNSPGHQAALCSSCRTVSKHQQDNLHD